MRVKIANRVIGEGEPCFIIAEAGVNHNGKTRFAKELIDVAKEAGADAVKFQTFNTGQLVSKGAEKAEYQIHISSGPKKREPATDRTGWERCRSSHVKIDCSGPQHRLDFP